MPITYDITKDSLYLKGMKDAETKSKKQWETSGAVQKEIQIIINMIKASKYSIREIAAITNTTEDYVLKIKEELESKK